MVWTRGAETEYRGQNEGNRQKRKIERNYYEKNINDNNVFGFLQGNYPYEFAPPIDYDEQFSKTILDPINRFIEAMGHNPISPNLFMLNALF